MVSIDFALALSAWVAVAPGAPRQEVAFVDVTVVPMDRPRVLHGQTVVIRDDRIIAVGPRATTVVPEGAAVIPSTGYYLMPGLADMHVHFFRDPEELALYVANGVTTVRELSGEPLYLGWRSAIREGTLVGPNIYLAGPVVDGAIGRRADLYRAMTAAAALAAVLWAWWVTRKLGRARWRIGRPAMLATASLAAGAVFWTVPIPDGLIPRGNTNRTYVGPRWEVARAVRKAADQYDQIKLYDRLTAGQFAAGTRAAARVGAHTVGHVPRGLETADAVALGLDEVAHAYFLVEDVLRAVPTAAGVPDSALDGRRRQRLHEDVARLGSSSVAVTSTVALLAEIREMLMDSARFLARGTMQYRRPEARRILRDRIGAGATPDRLRFLSEQVRWGGEAVAALTAAGVPVVLGTDANPNAGVAGFATHDELAFLVSAGLEPFEALRSATTRAAALVGAPEQWGMVAVGQRADLVLVAADPLRDVNSVRDPLGVMVAGRWYDRQILDDLLATVAARRAVGPSRETAGAQPESLTPSR